MGPKATPFHLDAVARLTTFSRPCPKIDFWLQFGCSLGSLWAPFGIPFASLWFPLIPFGSLFAPRGSLLAPVGTVLASLWFPWRSFSHF